MYYFMLFYFYLLFIMCRFYSFFFFFFFNDTATTEIYTLSLHDALPISNRDRRGGVPGRQPPRRQVRAVGDGDRKSTRLNSSHSQISYAVFCLKKKKKNYNKSLSSRIYITNNISNLAIKQ